MVETNSMFLCAVLAVVLTLQTVDCLTCYTCSSTTDPKCGETMEHKGSALDSLNTTCEGVTTACRKLVTEDAPKGTVLVDRSCWSSSSDEKLSDEFLSKDCNKVMGTGKACYCQKDLCNGRQPLTASAFLILLVSIVFPVLR